MKRDVPGGALRAASPSSLSSLRLLLLAAREARDDLARRLVARLPPGSCLVFCGTNVPGPSKVPRGLLSFFRRALALLARSPVLGRGRRLARGRDALGPWEAWAVPGDVRAVKALLVRTEEEAPGGRLLDLDAYAPDGTPVGRAALGSPPRRCLACGEPAVDCMRAARHDAAELAARVAALLGRGARARRARGC